MGLKSPLIPLYERGKLERGRRKGGWIPTFVGMVVRVVGRG